MPEPESPTANGKTNAQKLDDWAKVQYPSLDKKGREAMVARKLQKEKQNA